MASAITWGTWSARGAITASPGTTTACTHTFRRVPRCCSWWPSFGRHSAAALVHFTFFCTLPLLMVCWGRRFGIPKAGLFAAILIFASPVIAKDGVSAYNDLAVATLIYTVFYLLQVWDEYNSPNILILIGLLSGSAYGAKYTAFLALPFALAWVGFSRIRRGLAAPQDRKSTRLNS